MSVTILSKYLFILLLKRFKIPLGKKCYSVMIPEEVLEDKEKFIRTVRGIFDTDGCVFFDKRKSYKTPYVRIVLQLSNKILIKQIVSFLNSLGINNRYHEVIRKNKHKNDAYCIQINGVKNVKDYLNQIGFSNSRHGNKIKYLL